MADSQYKGYEEPFGCDRRGAFRKVDSTGNAKGGRFVESLIYLVPNPFTGDEVFPRKGRCWVCSKEEMLRMVADQRVFWGKAGKAGTPMRQLLKSEAKTGMTAPTIWDDVGLNQHAARARAAPTAPPHPPLRPARPKSQPSGPSLLRRRHIHAQQRPPQPSPPRHKFSA